jgi:hypothetical protein
MQAHVRSDVMRSYAISGLFNWLEYIDRGSIRPLVFPCVNLGCYKPLIGNTEKDLIFV